MADTFPLPPTVEEVILIRSGDVRQHRNRTTWPAQQRLEAALTRAFAAAGVRLHPIIPFDERLGHGYVWRQRMGLDLFREIDPEAPLVVAIAAWQYSHHLLGGLQEHRGPILPVAN